jgi:hypothetical protein
VRTNYLLKQKSLLDNSKMLNKKKQVKVIAKTQISEKFSFFNLPFLSSTSYLQTTSSEGVLDDLKLIFRKSSVENNLRNFRFSFSNKTFRSYSLLEEHTKQQKLNISYKRLLLLTNSVFMKNKRHSFFFVKSIKGGWMTTSLGLTAFMPKSRVIFSDIGKQSKQHLLRFKLIVKKKKRSSKKIAKINLVSSSKILKKND